MESSREVGKNFHIDLSHPPGYVFKDGDIVTGKCCLFSSADEDVGSVIISFHGTVKVRLVHRTDRQPVGYSQDYIPSNYDSEDVLFSEIKVLFQGPYTLRKNVPYEWPFEFQFPSRISLPPSSAFHKDHWNSAVVAYELEACRGKSEDVELLKKRIIPVNMDRNTSTQSRTIMERIGAFTGMLDIAPLRFMPPKGRLPDRTMASYKVEHRFPSTSPQSSGSHHHELSSLFHRPDPPAVGGNIILGLPRSLIHGASIPILLCIETSADITPVSLHTLEIHLEVFKTLISSLGHHRQTDVSKLTLFNESKASLPLSTNSTLDVGKTFNLQLDPNIVPTFSHVRVEVSYNIIVHLVLGCGGQRLKQNFLVEDIQIMSNRTPNSPLRLDHFCVFSCESQQSNPAPPAYPGIDRHEDAYIGSAYLRLSRLLTQNFIPHNPVLSRTGEPTIMLHGQPQLRESPPLSSQPSTSPFSVNSQEDTLQDDRYLLDSILDDNHGFKATGMRSGRDALERFRYTWQLPSSTLKERMRGVLTHLEILVIDTQIPPSSKAPPPPYSTALDPFSPTNLLNESLRHLANVQHLDASILSDIEYVIREFGLELRSRIGDIDTMAASDAMAKFEMLYRQLIDLGVDIESGRTLGDKKEKGKERQSWGEHHGNEKRDGVP